MIYPHVIRLAGPWECEVLRADSGGLTAPTAQRVQPPLDCGALFGSDFRGQVRFRRRFNRPTNLDPQEAVWLVIENSAARGNVRLSDESIGELLAEVPLAEFDVTPQLALHNELTIDAEHCGSISSVRLEIRRRPLAEA
jgi:hypothetical protein